MSKAKHVEKSIAWAKKKGFSEIKAEHEGFEKPISFTRSSDQREFTPDISAENNGKKHYFQVILKSDDLRDTTEQVTLFHTLAKMKSSKLYLMAPSGNLKFARELAEELELSEVVHI